MRKLFGLFALAGVCLTGVAVAQQDCGNTGPDVIVGDLPDVSNYGISNNILGFTIGTTSCNVGNTPINWISNNNQHPVIGENLFRLENGRFEQIGQSWLKHAFAALQDNICNCNCQPWTNSSRLGVGCSDPYNAGTNGSQGGLGPKSEVNSETGIFPYPFTGQGQTGNSIYKRLQVHLSDIDPTAHHSAMFFAEGQYVTQDDSAAGNQYNNCSYRRIAVTGRRTLVRMTFARMPAVVREKAAIEAWAASDATVRLTDMVVAGEGRVIVGVKTTSLGGGLTHYEYAIQNINFDRGFGSVTINAAGATTVTNIGFHDVDYHSGEPFDGTDWVGTFDGQNITWATTPYGTNQNANALRWGTLYNFRFDSDAAPGDGTIELGIFKPGATATLEVSTTTP